VEAAILPINVNFMYTHIAWKQLLLAINVQYTYTHTDKHAS